MNTPLRLGLLQYGIARLGGLDDYATRFDALVADGAAHADLLVMPEYSCMELAGSLVASPDPREELRAVCARSHSVLEIMREAARRHRVWLQPGTLPWADGDRVRNRAPLIASDGAVVFQDKHVMTRFEAETWNVQAGSHPAVFATPWGPIGIAICYDSEFPPLVRAQVSAGAWLVLVPTCTDSLHGFNRVRLSARARALENQCYVAVAPTVGEAPWLATLDFNRGRAGIYSPIDRGFSDDGIVVEGVMDRPGWIFATLDPDAIDAVRSSGAVLNHRDWPGHVPACPLLKPESLS